MLHKEDPVFKKLVDTATAALFQSPGAEGRVRQAVGFAGAGFLQGDVRRLAGKHL
jgi:hypothetical protein